MGDQDEAFNAKYGERSASFGSGKYRGVVHLAGPTLTIDAGGRVFRFEWHSYFGPSALDKLGNPKLLPMRSPFWRAIELWIAQGKRVDENNRALWEATP